MDTEIPSLSYNVMFKAVFSDEPKLLSYLVKAIIDYCQFDIDIADKEITIKQNELPIDNYHDRNYVCDYVIEINDSFLLNIEINRIPYNGLVERNLCYSFKLYCEKFKPGTKKDDFTKFCLVQVNFNRYTNPDKRSINRYLLIDADNISNNLTDKFLIINVDIEKCRQLVYNETNLDGLTDLEIWGAIIASSYLEEIQSILERGLNKMSIKNKEKLVKKIKKAAEDKEVQNKYRLEDSFEDRLRYIRNMEREAAREEAKKEITKEVTEKVTNEVTERVTANMIKGMLKKKVSFEDISEITGIEVDKVKKINIDK